MNNKFRYFIYFFGSLVLLFLVMPTFIVIPISFSSAQYLKFPPPGFSLQWYEAFFGNEDWVQSLLLSFKVGVVTMICATVLGTLVSIALSRSSSKWVQSLYFLVMAPMLIPLIIVALVVYTFFMKLGISGTFLGMVIAHTIIALPFVIITVLGALQSFDVSIEKAAVSLGAHPFVAFLKVTVPIISPALFSGALFAFIASFDEVIISSFVSGPLVKTLPVKMWESLRLQIDPTIAAIASILIAITTALFFASTLLNYLRSKKAMD